TLGRTGLNVSVAGLGCGGGSGLGSKQGKSEAHSIGIVHQAVDLGVNFLDTAKAYGTEAIVGKAVQSLQRDALVISTKSSPLKDGERMSTEEIIANLDQSLRDLKTDYVDVFNLHSLQLKDYDYAMDVLVPALLKEKEKGKFRFLGATEQGPRDLRHEMFLHAFDDDPFDVIMVAYNMMNQGAEQTIFPETLERRIGTLIMFAVRAVFSVAGRLQQDINKLVEDGQLPQWLADTDNPLGFLIHEDGAESIIDAAYRYVRHQPGADVVLFGTGNPEHLETNLASILKPPLPDADVARMRELFAHLTGFGLDFPAWRKADKPAQTKK
ncbi:MAG: aldo/keto reductase, partial [Rhodospirillaceae bacterium]|nr:aldo/keto reductase [Rhodospirillaceae bacterium]